MTTFTSTLPDELWNRLNRKANELSVPKNKLIERALSVYLEQLNKAEYVKSFKQMAADADVMNIAEEGLAEYFRQIGNEEM